MRILIVTAQVPFVRGGAEILCDGLRKALDSAGHKVDVASIPFKWYPANIIPDQMLGARLLDLSEFSGERIDRVVALKFPAYLIPHEQKVLWLVHQHREAYDLYSMEGTTIRSHPLGREIMDFIRRADTEVLESEFARRFTISRNVSSRLRNFNDVDSSALYHPPQSEGNLYRGGFDNYFFFPSRMNLLKRQSLAIEALAKLQGSTELVLAGEADSAQYESELKALAEKLGIAERVRFLGYIDERQKLDLYANCRAVVYPPYDEDYGYVTLEAMLSGKPVITCTDSGGVLEFIDNGGSGLVREPEAEPLAEAMMHYSQSIAHAKEAGATAFDRYHSMNITWSNVVEKLAG